MKHLDIIKSKIYSWKELRRQIAIWRFSGNRIVFTNGCFDLLHPGHIEYLSQAADEGNILIIGLNTDESVRKLKGSSRPVLNETARSMILASLHFVDAVVLFDEETPLNLIKLVHPDVLIKGGDYAISDIVGSDIVLNDGGEVKTIEFVQGYSSSDIIKRIIDK